jgi:anion-transporting  ArsA/GET3 family ATPase
MKRAELPREALARLMEDHKVMVCVGSGGVGKTTTAAALGLYGATIGKRTLVITIDPAKRLANALGLTRLAHDAQRIDDAVLAQAGVKVAAPLSAMMLDPKAAWDHMLKRTAPTREAAEKILSNRFYDALSRDLPGAHEFIACEALHHVVDSGAYDLVVLDTPPTQNALDFLEAPGRILAVLDSDAFRLFSRTADTGVARLGLRFLETVSGTAQSVLAKFTGAHMLDELGDFILLWKDLYAPLTKRAKSFEKMLRADTTRFVVVTSPQPAALAEATFFRAELDRRGLPLGAVVVNRVMPPPFADGAPVPDATAARAALARSGVDDPALAGAVAEAARAQAEDAAQDARAAQRVVDDASAPVVQVPRLAGDVHDASGLRALLPWLVGAYTDP